MPTKLSPDAAGHKSWREALRVHPAAELFPSMGETELRELADDIKRRGLYDPPSFYRDPKLGVCVLDGRNRLDALELIGWPADITSGRIIQVAETEPFDPVAFVLSKNLHRRHLTADQRRDLIANVLKAKPETSNRQIAKQVKADDKTVAKVRTELEATAEIPQLKKTVGGDGKSRKTRKATNTKPSTATSATEVAARLLVEVTAHAVKADPTKVGRLLAKKLSPELIDKLFGWLNQVFLMARQLDLDLDRDGHGEKSEAAE